MPALLLFAAALAAAEPVAHRFDASASTSSRVVAIARRGGALRFLGHEHAIEARDWTAWIAYDPAVPSSSSVTMSVKSASLVIDSEEARRLAGLGAGPGPKDVAKISRTMLGPTVLDAERFPEIRFESVEIGADGPGLLRVRGRLTLRGVTREETARVSLQETPFRVRTELKIRQTAYGIQPASVAGVVKVKDELELRLDLGP